MIIRRRSACPFSDRALSRYSRRNGPCERSRSARRQSHPFRPGTSHQRMDIPKPYRTRTFDMLIRNETAASSEDRETDTALRLLSPCRPLSAALRSTESLPNNRGTNRRLTEKLPAYWKRPGTASGKDAERSAGTPLFSNGAFLAAIRATTGDVSNFRQRPVPKPLPQRLHPTFPVLRPFYGESGRKRDDHTSCDKGLGTISEAS